MRVFPANIRRCCPEPAGNGAGKCTWGRISKPVTDVGDRKITFHQKLESGILANGILYLVEIGPEFGKATLKLRSERLK